MNEKEFKILTHCGTYVDYNLLEKGIYSTSKPHLFSKDETIDSLINKTNLANSMGGCFSDNYFENLKQCKLTNVSLLTDVNF